jgi:hypothetical protein
MVGNQVAAFTYSTIRGDKLYVEYQCQRSTYATCAHLFGASEASGELSFVESLATAVASYNAKKAEILNADSFTSTNMSSKLKAQILNNKELFSKYDFKVENRASHSLVNDRLVETVNEVARMQWEYMGLHTSDLEASASQPAEGDDGPEVAAPEPSPLNALDDPCTWKQPQFPGPLHPGHVLPSLRST